MSENQSPENEVIPSREVAPPLVGGEVTDTAQEPPTGNAMSGGGEESSAGQQAVSGLNQGTSIAPGASQLAGNSSDAPQGDARSFLDAAIGFDPKVHATNADGSPKMTKGGEFARKRGRKPGQQSGAASTGETTSSVPPVDGQTPNAVPVVDLAGTREAARMIATMFCVGTSRIIGEEWSPQKGELEMLSDATEKYLVSIGGLKVSPLAGMVLAYGTYSAMRLNHVNTQTKLQRAWGWMKKQARGAASMVGL